MDGERSVELVIGTKMWSTWSLRPWLVAQRSGLEVTETLVPLRFADVTEAAILAAGSPSGLVPVLRDGDLVIWDSLAICEYLAELAPEAMLWPKERSRRALARAATAEMHSGFQALRQECPMDLGRTPVTAALSVPTQKDVRRIVALWTTLRTLGAADGPYLLGGWSIADAFFTPVATRMRTYGVRLCDFGDEGVGAAYVETLLTDKDFAAWEAAARLEA
jgi:glutathione S-transferase